MIPRTLCQNKAEYATAQLVLAKHRERQLIERMRLYAYRCQLCDMYHLTKLKPPPDSIVSLISGKTRRES